MSLALRVHGVEIASDAAHMSNVAIDRRMDGVIVARREVDDRVCPARVRVRTSRAPRPDRSRSIRAYAPRRQSPGPGWLPSIAIPLVTRTWSPTRAPRVRKGLRPLGGS